MAYGSALMKVVAGWGTRHYLLLAQHGAAYRLSNIHTLIDLGSHGLAKCRHHSITLYTEIDSQHKPINSVRTSRPSRQRTIWTV